MSPAERFWFKVDKSGECWLWQGGTNGRGYGLVHLKNPERTLAASRYAWELTHTPINYRYLFVCHHCDNPPCVRPEHLFLGTSLDNILDSQRKGRRPIRRPRILKGYGAVTGERNFNAKLTADAVRQMRVVYARGEATMSELAAWFGVNIALVHRIIHRNIWKHVAA